MRSALERENNVLRRAVVVTELMYKKGLDERSVTLSYRYYHHSYSFSEATGLNEDGSEVKRTAAAETGAPAAFIAVQPFPALLDLPLGSDAIKASCGSRHTAVVTSEWSWVGWFRMEQEVTPPRSLASGCRESCGHLKHCYFQCL